jgi:hypothetical protein
MDITLLTLSDSKKGPNKYLYAIGSTENLEKSELATGTIFVCGLETLTLALDSPQEYSLKKVP